MTRCTITLFIMFLISACQHPPTWRYMLASSEYNYTFTDPDEGYSDAKTFIEMRIVSVERRNDPIAGRAIFIAYTREFLESQIKDNYGLTNGVTASNYTVNDCIDYFRTSLRLLHSPCRPPFSYLADLVELDHLSVPRVIQRKNLFSSIEILRADSLDEASVPEDVYLLRYGTSGITFSGENGLYIRSPCGTDWTLLNPGTSLSVFGSLVPPLFEVRESAFNAAAYGRLEAHLERAVRGADGCEENL